MAEKPFVDQEQRPDLTVNMEGKVGELTVRDLVSILGGGEAGAAKLKEAPAEKPVVKEPKDHKDIKDHKEPKDHKDQKEQKDHKDPKDHKDQKDQKEQKDHKDHKDQKEQKDHKDPKDPKEQKDTKDHKEPKDTKDHKDVKDRKEHIKEPIKEPKEPVDLVAKAPAEAGPGGSAEGSELDALIKRVSGLEQAVESLTKKK